MIRPMPKLTPDEKRVTEALHAAFDWRDPRYILRVARCAIAALGLTANSDKAK